MRARSDHEPVRFPLNCKSARGLRHVAWEILGSHGKPWETMGKQGSRHGRRPIRSSCERRSTAADRRVALRRAARHRLERVARREPKEQPRHHFARERSLAAARTKRPQPSERPAAPSCPCIARGAPRIGRCGAHGIIAQAWSAKAAERTSGGFRGESSGSRREHHRRRATPTTRGRPPKASEGAGDAHLRRHRA